VREQVIFLGVCMATITGGAVIAVTIVTKPLEIIMALPTYLGIMALLFTIGGFSLGVFLRLMKEREYEEAIKAIQEESVKPRGDVMVMPWDQDIVGIYIQRSAIRYVPQSPQPEAVG